MPDREELLANRAWAQEQTNPDPNDPIMGLEYWLRRLLTTPLPPPPYLSPEHQEGLQQFLMKTFPGLYQYELQNQKQAQQPQPPDY